MANMENEAFTFAEVTKVATEADQRSRSNTHRINELAKKQTEMDKLVTAVATMANEQEHIKDDVRDIKSDVKTLVDAPGKRWNAVVEKIIIVIIGAVVGALLMRVGIPA